MERNGTANNNTPHLPQQQWIHNYAQFEVYMAAKPRKFIYFEWWCVRAFIYTCALEKLHFSIIFDLYVAASPGRLTAPHQRATHSTPMPCPRYKIKTNPSIHPTAATTLRFLYKIHFYAYKCSKWHHIKCVTLFLCRPFPAHAYNSPIFLLFHLVFLLSCVALTDRFGFVRLFHTNALAKQMDDRKTPNTSE